MTAAIFVLAVLLDAILGEPRRWHPLVGFGALATGLERYLNTAGQGVRGRVVGLLAVLLLVVPLTLIPVFLAPSSWQPLVGLAVLYLVLGGRSLQQHAVCVEQALNNDDPGRARQGLARMVSRDTDQIDEAGIAAATVESVLENGNDAIFGALFWFLLAGAPGALMYRLVNTLDAMWGYRNDRYRYFGWAAARIDDLMNWLPARLTAASYVLLGNGGKAWRCWRQQAPAWISPNAGAVMAAGAGALDIRLGGGAHYHGQWQERPQLGTERTPQTKDIARARQLVWRTTLLWLLLVLCVQGVVYLV